jgi:hypothetical protein
VSTRWGLIMKSRGFLATTVVAIGVVLLMTLLLRGEDRVTSGGDAADRPTATKSRVPTTATSPLESIAPTQGDASTSPAPASRIETTSLTYFGRPFETIHIPGRYRGVPGSTRLRVQVKEPDGWTPYPLPTVTQPSGQFRAFIELGEAGKYRLRIVDPARHQASEVVTLLVF